MHTTDNTRLVLIDLEFTGFNPIAYDIGTILNETVCCNASLTYYTENFPDKRERE